MDSSTPKMIAYCGLVCSNCPTYLATQADDDEARTRTAAYYRERFGLKFKPEEINCDGCLSQGGRLLGYCSQCAIRACATEKGLANCAACAEVPCARLTKFHAFSPEAKASFEALRR